ncbi:MAG: DNA-binding response regulator, partial [Bacteroidetes bacterium]
LIADAQYLIRYGLRELLIYPDSPFEIVGEVTDEADLLEALKTLAPRVVIIDYNQPEHFNVDTILKIRREAPQTNILVISDDHKKHQIYQVLEYGISSYLTKHCGETEIIDAVKATAKDEKFFCNNVLNHILEKSFPREDDCSPTPLTPREIEVVRLAASGMIAKEIANELNLSTHTIYTHRKNIMKKLNINTASELVLYAVNNGIL